MLINNQDIVTEKKVGVIKNCANTGNITGNYLYQNLFSDSEDHSKIGIGGIVGVCDDIPVVSDVTEHYLRLVDWLRKEAAKADTWTQNFNIGMWEIKNCYSSGEVTGGKGKKKETDTTTAFNASVGGILGYNYTNSGTRAVTDCYYKLHTVNFKTEDRTFLWITYTWTDEDGGINGKDRPLMLSGWIGIYAKGDDTKTSNGIQSIRDYINSH